jgi:hypothetical protein
VKVFGLKTTRLTYPLCALLCAQAVAAYNAPAAVAERKAQADALAERKAQADAVAERKAQADAAAV